MEMHLEIFEIFLEMVIDLNNYTSISIKLLSDNEYAHVFDTVQCTFQKNFGSCGCCKINEAKGQMNKTNGCP